MSIITNSHGPVMVGIFLSLIMYGAMITQVAYYYTNYPTDRTWIKLYVFVILFVDTVSTVFAIWWLYNLFINEFGNMLALTQADWRLAADPALIGITGTICQLFFAWRIRILSKSVLLAAIVTVVSVGSGACALATGIRIGIVGSLLPQDFPQYQTIGAVWLALTALVDILITVIISWALRQAKSQTKYRETELFLNKIVRLTLQNGLLTTVIAVVELVLFLTDFQTSVHMALGFILAKLYCNSVLSSLCARTVQNGSAHPTQASQYNSEINSGQNYRIPRRKQEVVNLSTNQRPEVFVHVEQHELKDHNGYRTDDSFTKTPVYDGNV